MRGRVCRETKQRKPRLQAFSKALDWRGIGGAAGIFSSAEIALRIEKWCWGGCNCGHTCASRLDKYGTIQMTLKDLVNRNN